MTDAATQLKPVNRGQIAEQVVQQIVSLIEARSLKPGDRLPSERRMAEKMGIGRPALREALRAMSLIGVLDIRHGGGVYVSSLSPEALLGPLHLYIGLEDATFETIIEARRVIEGATVVHAATRINDEQLDTLMALVEQMELLFIRRPDDQMAVLQELTRQFRNTIKQAAGNSVISRALEGLDIMSTVARQQLRNDNSLIKQICRNHRALAEALAKHDPVGARSALMQHLDDLEKHKKTDLRTPGD